MPKPDLKTIQVSEPEYDIVDIEQEDAPQASYDEAIDPDYDAEVDPDYDEPSQDTDYELSDPDYEVVADEQGPMVISTTMGRAPAAVPGYAFELGRAVLPLTQAQPHPVVWRGHLKERNPTTGLVQRVPVYRLADGYWDCYREEDLQAA